MDIFSGKTLTDKKHQTINAEEILRNKVAALYFSAGWCPPCKQFTPLLAEVYNELMEKKSPFEIVFVSSDKSVQDMRQYMQEMHADWPCLPFGDPFISELKTMYNVKSIPKLVVIKENGEVITEQGRKEVQDRGVHCFKNWVQAANIIQNFTAD
ncbi:nucleoredoxin-like protein 2 [Ptychodera flava]|uniref:nucleoredoxin-like protein 2 n=1 Tax=Ptychodera flava TaxID=63121 RepID=UPI003969C739